MKRNDEDLELMTVKEVAQYTKLTTQYVYQIPAEELPRYKFPHAVRFARRDVNEWLKRKRTYTKQEIDCSAVRRGS